MTYKELYAKYGEIKIKCQGSTSLPLDAIMDFQGALKKRTKKNKLRLAERMFKLDFIAPFFVWENKGDYHCLDGHSRTEVLCEIRKEGIPIPGMFPVDFIHAKDIKEAKEILLSISSQYGDFIKEELEEWISDLDDDINDNLRLLEKEINIEKENIQEKDDLEVIQEELKPYRQVHYLISFKLNNIISIEKFEKILEDFTKNNEVEIVKGSN